MCSEELGCTLCYEWNVHLDNTGGATADAILSGDCLNSTLVLSGFSDSLLEMCSSMKRLNVFNGIGINNFFFL